MVPFTLPLRPTSDVPLHLQLYRELREAVLTGRLTPGGRLPSTRTLASDLSVSRNTVCAAFDQLLAEGYLTGKVGSGTYVVDQLPEDMLVARPASRRLAMPARKVAPLSRRGAVLAANPVIPRRPHREPRPFRPSPPAVRDFPWRIWSRLTSRHWRGARNVLLSYADAAGYAPLREAIAAYARSSRGVRCDADQVVVVAGSQQGLDLAVRLLLDPGDTAWLEDPGYLGARGTLLAAGARIAPCPLDADGLDVATAAQRRPHARLVYVTPSHQFPLGVTMSLARRLALLEWAASAGAWIIEDDYDSEFRYTGRPIASLQGLDHAGRVLYLGTFSKVLFPSLRLGYLILPPDLVDPFSGARALTDLHSPLIDQAVLTDFITEGHFVRHIRRMRALYAERQAALVDAASRYLSGALDLDPSPAGMHLVGWLKSLSGVEASRRAAAAGIEAPPLTAYAIEKFSRQALLLGYAAYTPRELRDAARKLAAALEAGPRFPPGR